MNNYVSKLKETSLAVYGFAAAVTGIIYLLSTMLLPLVFNASKLHMNTRNGILIAIALLILFISATLLPSIIYLTGTKTQDLREVNWGALIKYIKRSMKGVLFFVLSSFIWAIFCGLLAVLVHAALKNSTSYENIKLVIGVIIVLLSIFVAPLIIIETFSAMLRKGGMKDRLKAGLTFGMTKYVPLFKKILLLFLIGLFISAIGLVLRISIVGEILMFIIWSVFGGIGLTRLTEYTMDIFRGRKKGNE